MKILRGFLVFWSFQWWTSNRPFSKLSRSCALRFVLYLHQESKFLKISKITARLDPFKVLISNPAKISGLSWLSKDQNSRYPHQISRFFKNFDCWLKNRLNLNAQLLVTFENGPFEVWVVSKTKIHEIHVRFLFFQKKWITIRNLS